jgi:hypothetical protein
MLVSLLLWMNRESIINYSIAIIKLISKKNNSEQSHYTLIICIWQEHKHTSLPTISNAFISMFVIDVGKKKNKFINNTSISRCRYYHDVTNSLPWHANKS